MHHIYHNLLIKSDAKKVFDAFTNPIHLNNWWTLTSSGTPVLDSEYNLNFTDQYNWFGTVSKVIENQCFFITMTISDEDWNGTTFGIELENHTEGTYLKFSHKNWQKDNDHFKHSSFCWALLLKGLKDYLEKGIVIPFESRN